MYQPGCETVIDAVEVTERYEAIVGDSTKKKRSSFRKVTEANYPEQSNKNHSEDNQMAEALDKLTRLFDRIDERNGQTNRGYGRPNSYSRNFRKPLACHVCGQIDHLVKNCAAFSKGKEEFRAQQQSQRKQDTQQKSNSSRIKSSMQTRETSDPH